jgi:hypothetical protein
MSILSMWKSHAVLLVFILAVAPLSASLQDMEEAVVVDVPFAFQNGSQHFAAGRYTIRLEDNNVLVVRGETRAGLAMVWFDDDSRPSNTTKVVFRRYGDQYFLHEVWVTGETRHPYCLPSKAENREMAATKAVPTSVVVAALAMPASGEPAR